METLMFFINFLASVICGIVFVVIFTFVLDMWSSKDGSNNG